MVISIGTGRKLLIHCHPTPLCRVTSQASPCFHPQPAPHHLTVWIGPAHQAEALLGKAMQSTEWPPSFLPPRTPAVSVLIVAALAHPAPAVASPNELVSTPAETPGGYSRQANAVFRMGLRAKRTFFWSTWPSAQKNIPSPKVNGGHSRQANAVFRVTSH